MGMIINPYVFGVAYDADAQAFITASGITDNTQKNAINTLVTDLKGYGIWTKMKAIYPFVGGTASTHKWNLKDPRDLDAAYRLTFSGGWTHSSTGSKPNGMNGYSETNIVPSNVLNQNSTHISVYIRTNTSSNTIAIGAARTPTNALNIFPDYFGITYIRVNSANDTGFNTGGGHLGFFLGNRISSSETRNMRNSTRYINQTQSDGITTNSIKISLEQDYPNEFSLVSIGNGLTDTEASNLYTSVQAFQTTLGRQV